VGERPFTGDVGWLACHPEHRGRGLGLSLTSHVTERFLIGGYERIQLHTEYYRLAAIKTYLKLGYVPNIGSPDVADLWREVCSQLDWGFSSDDWSRGDR
jgi:mycothiol synthase